MTEKINIIVRHNCEKCGNPQKMYWCSECESSDESVRCGGCGKIIQLDKDYHKNCNEA